VEIGIIRTPNNIPVVPISSVEVIPIGFEARNLNLTNNLVRGEYQAPRVYGTKGKRLVFTTISE
jgi:hypothetical protein